MNATSNELIAERLLRVIDEGRRTATYKLALLLALMNLCATRADAAGRPPRELATSEIADHVLEIYWPQTRPFVRADGSHQLRQIRGANSRVLASIYQLRSVAESRGLRRLAQLRAQQPDAIRRTVNEIDVTFAREPIPRLQILGNGIEPFLYDIDWGTDVPRRRVLSGELRLRFRPPGADALVRLAPLVRPLVELHWSRMVAQLNSVDLEGDLLHDHLFGQARDPIPATVRQALLELQDGCCLYCGDTIRRMEVDHFVPWSRWPNSAVENLVVADRHCNNDKRDALPSPRHIENWRRRNELAKDRFTELSAAQRCASAPDRSLAVARATYGHLASGTPLWDAVGQYVPHLPARTREALR